MPLESVGRRLVAALPCLIGGLALATCHNGTGGGPPGCVPGDSKGCTGPGACSGYQVCANDGKSYGACVCGPGGSGTGGGGASSSSTASSGTGGLATSSSSASSGTGASTSSSTTASSSSSGGCAITCSAPAPSSAQCTAGRCLVTLASGQSTPWGIAVSATDVYWINSNNGNINLPGASVMFAPIGGGASTTVDTLHGGYGIAVDATSVYWLSDVPPGPNDLVLKAPLGGGTVTTLSSEVIGFVPYDIAVSSTSVYWINGKGVFSVPLDGGTTRQLTNSASRNWLAVNSADVYFQSDLNTLVMVQVDAGAAYDPNGGTYHTMGGNFGCSQGGIAVSSTNVYTACNGNLESFPLTLNGVTTLGGGGMIDAIGLAIDGSNAYWTDKTGHVQKMPLAGGPVTTLASGQTGQGIAVDANSVYWTNTSGTVMQLTPK